MDFNIVKYFVHFCGENAKSIMKKKKIDQLTKPVFWVSPKDY